MHVLTRRFVLIAAAAMAVARPVFAKGAGISTSASGVAIQGYDTRAYWSAGTAMPGVESFEVTWRDVPWRFGSQSEADSFAADPARYAPQFGGFCTRAMSLKKVVDGDPQVWRIFEDKLYLFARPVGREVFDKGETDMIARAQAHWDTLG